MLNYTLPPASWLFWGGDQSGKSWMLGSAIKDPVTHEVLRHGLVLDVENKLGHLELPPEALWDIRPEIGDPRRILSEVRRWIGNYRRDLHKDGFVPYEVIGLDSITDYQRLYRIALGQEANRNNPKEDPDVLSERSWGKIYDRIVLDLGYLKAQQLGAHFIATAGMMKLESTATYTYDEVLEDGRLQPAIQGQLRRAIGNIFDMVVYVEKVWPGKRKGGEEVKEAMHRYHFAKNGDFKVRNGFEHLRRLPPYLDATASKPLTFDNILQVLEGK